SGGKSAAAPATVSGEPLARPPRDRGGPLSPRVREGRAGGVDPRARRPAGVALTKAAGRGAPGAGDDHASHHTRPPARRFARREARMTIASNLGFPRIG